MTYEESMRILLNGTCGANTTLVERETGLVRQTVMGFLRGSVPRPETQHKLGWFIWTRMNAHVLLSDADRVVSEEVIAERKEHGKTYGVDGADPSRSTTSP